MRNTVAYPTQQSSSPSRGIPCSHKRGSDESQRYNCFTRNGGNATLDMPVQRLKVASLPLDLPCSGPVTHSGEILTTGKSHGKKPDRISLNGAVLLLRFISRKLLRIFLSPSFQTLGLN